MRNKTIKISCILACLLFNFNLIHAQNSGETIYSYNGVNIVTQSKFIDPAYYPKEYPNITPYIAAATALVTSQNKSDSYRVNMYKYNGFEDEAGFCNVIDIVQNGTTLLQIKDGGGWENTYDDLKCYFTVSKRFIYAPISDTAIALIFTGHSYQSEPPRLTIIVIDSGKAALVFNKAMLPLELSQTADFFSLIASSNSPALNDNGTSTTPYIKHKIWSENGIIRFKDL